MSAPPYAAAGDVSRPAAAVPVAPALAGDPEPPVAVMEPDVSDDPAGEWEPESALEEPVSADWLDRICPYLLSEDGTSRSAQPDDRHRCMAQEPPASLPLLFQERFCLTDRHVRCEMYKQAEGARSMVLAQDSIPAEQVRSARFRPSVRSRPIALEPTAAAGDEPRDGLLARRPVAAALAGAAGIAVVLMALVLLFGGSGTPPGPLGSASPSVPPVTPLPVPTQTRAPDPSATPDVAPSTEPEAGFILIRYELQEDERLLKVAEKWGVSRFAITQANPGDVDPRTARAGEVIIVPVPAGTPLEAIEATPGFAGYVEE